MYVDPTSCVLGLQNNYERVVILSFLFSLFHVKIIKNIYKYDIIL
jgi:hypothetical protein